MHFKVDVSATSQGLGTADGKRTDRYIENGWPLMNTLALWFLLLGRVFGLVYTLCCVYILHMVSGLIVLVSKLPFVPSCLTLKTRRAGSSFCLAGPYCLLASSPFLISLSLPHCILLDLFPRRSSYKAS